ncbi:hypothetical protein [Neobacillus sp. LXY-4]|uniref:hypothetical protein n=1 Tax=Neobacillus sp. LXY-4 TaxID=3379826 RepID=UPI003EE33F7A
MFGETLPSWFWVIYYLFLFVTLGIAIMCVIRKKMKVISIITIVLTITVPINSMLNSIGRAKGDNELEHLVTQLQLGSIWSFYAVVGYLYLIAFWVMLLVKYKMNTEVSH